MAFLEWNDAIAGHFFRPVNAGRTVYLYVTPQLLDEIGETSGRTASDFIATMKAGPSWATRSGLCQKAFQAMSGWRDRNLRYPPYVGYLALFVLASGHEGDFAPHAYYPRLRELLSEPASPGQYPSFHRMLEVWSDLEKWANRENRGELGLLRLDIAGSWLHVGLPVAQTILTEAERLHVQTIFVEAGLDWDDPPPDAELAQLLTTKGPGLLRRRTLNALSPAQLDSEYSSVLLDRILEELETSPHPDVDSEETAPARDQRGTLLLSLRLDTVARRAAFPLYARLLGSDSDTLEVKHDGVTYSCSLLADGRSTAFTCEQHQSLDGARFDWAHAIELPASSGVVLRALPRNVRTFTDGSAFGVPGFIESRLIDPSRPFAVASTGSATLHIQTWGAHSCTNFREHHVDGVPSGWVLFTASGATADAEIRTHVPQLSFARHLRRIRLEGGLHLPGTSQVFFRFAPPLVRLEGAGASAVLRFNEGPPADPDPTGRFSIPEDLLDQDVIDVCCTDGDVTRRRQIYLRDQLADAGAPFVPLAYAESGERTPPSGGEWLACGVPAGSAVPCSAPLVLPLGPQDAADLVGADPGQIAQYRPTEPPEWEPIWAVIHHRRTMSATFVGSDLRPPGNSRSSNRARLRDWKDLLWHQRKRIRPPVFEPARILWQSYQNAARYV